MLTSIMGEEALSMCSMSMGSVEEYDTLLGALHKSRCYTRVSFPNPIAWIKHWHFLDSPKHDQDCEVSFCTCITRKNWSGTLNSVLLTKTYSIELMLLFEQSSLNTRFLGLLSYLKSLFSS